MTDMKKSEVLSVVVIPQPINGQLFVDVAFSCSSCADGKGVVRLTDIQWQQMKTHPLSNYECQRCRGDVQ
jgi:hypothetical protein